MERPPSDPCAPGQAERERALTERVRASFAACPDPRLRALLEGLVDHLHAYLREQRVTEAEWVEAIRFLTAAGDITDERRQEFVLLSDVLGASMQTITINHPAAGTVTEATVLGPFFTEDAPYVELGGDIAAGASGEPCWVEGSVRADDGRPVAGARLEVWEADDEGRYDVQYPDGRTAGRAHLFTDADGAYRFWAVAPTPYPIPDDGPVGRLLAATRRSPLRAPHLHFKVTACGCRTLITHIFVEGAPLLATDSVFGVRDSLVMRFERHAPGDPRPDGRDLDGRGWASVRFEIVLAAA